MMSEKLDGREEEKRKKMGLEHIARPISDPPLLSLFPSLLNILVQSMDQNWKTRLLSPGWPFCVRVG